MSPDRRSRVDRLRDALDRMRPAAILVDCFGTLLTRSVPPSQVKRLAARRLATLLGLEPATAEDLLETRRATERRIVRENVERGRDAELSLEQLYPRWRAEAVERGIVPARPADRFAAAAREAEITAELSVLAPDPNLVAVLDPWRSRARLALVSDTYLGEGVLRDILRGVGTEDLFSLVVASGDFGATKRSGRLYPLVLSRLAVPETAGVVMIGDDPLADEERAQEAGLATFLLPRARWDRKGTAILRAVERDVARRVDRLLEPRAAADLFPAIALTLYVALRRLDAEIRRLGATEVFFLAREGRFLARLYEVYQQASAIPPASQVAGRYLLVSRRATYLPSLAPLPEESFDLLASRYPGLERRDVLRSLGFEGEELRELETGVGGSEEADGHFEISSLAADPAFRRAFERRRMEQREALASYLGREGLAAARPAILVDVGWQGSIQDQIAAVLGDREIVGLYLGLASERPIRNLAAKRAVLFANQPAKTPHFQVFSHFKTLFEVVLSAGHGSVRAYAWKGGEAVPVLDPHAEESRAHRELVEPLQTRIEERFRELCRELGRSARSEDEMVDFAARRHARMIYAPRSAEMRFFERLVFYENFGRIHSRRVWDRSGRASAPSPSRPSRILRPRSLVTGGGWPPLRMRAAGLGWLRFPYSWYKLLTRERP